MQSGACHGVLTCSGQSLVHGVYGVTWEGAFGAPAPGQSQPVVYPFSQIGVGAYDYAGKGSGAATMSLGGRIVPSALPDLTLTVNEDCTGVVKYTGATIRIVVLNGGDEMLAIFEQLSSGSPIMLGNYKRMSALPVLPNW